jgi:hypothetical protein
MRHISMTFLSAALFATVSASTAFAWGAIAVDDDYGEDPADAGYAFVTDDPSRNAAAADAMATCQSSGNDNCRLVLTFQNCGAYAASKTQYGAGAGTTVQQAERRALADCNGSDCQIVVSDCQ